MNIENFKLKYQKKKVLEESNYAPKTPLVSVLIQTYQHVDYIKLCLDSILMQKTNFEFEILLGEDASDDGTREICLNYAKQHPNKIRLFLHHRENNIHIGGYPTGRFILLYNLTSARGKYIALCEGDDYWTDPLKLQKQVDFLEVNPEYVICGCDRNLIDKYNNVIIESGKKDINKQGLTTLTVVFRNQDFEELFFKFFAQVSNGDTILFLYLEQLGKSILLDFKGANYRLHEGGMWSSITKEKRYKNSVNSYFLIIKYFELTKNKEFIKKSCYHLANIEIGYGYSLIKRSLYKKALRQFFKFNKIFIYKNLYKSYFLLIKINIVYLFTLIKSRITKF